MRQMHYVHPFLFFSLSPPAQFLTAWACPYCGPGESRILEVQRACVVWYACICEFGVEFGSSLQRSFVSVVRATLGGNCADLDTTKSQLAVRERYFTNACWKAIKRMFEGTILEVTWLRKFCECGGVLS